MNWSEKHNSGGVAVRRSLLRVEAQPAAVPRIEVCIFADSRIAAEAMVWSLGQMLDIHARAANAQNPELAGANANVMLVDAAVADSVSMAEALAHEHPDAKLIVTNLDPRDARISEFVTRGVAGFVLKDASLDELAGTIRTVAGGMTVLPAILIESLFSRLRDDAGEAGTESDEPAPRFTRREQEVVNLVCAGLNTRVISTQLNISRHTVKSHVRSVLVKLSLHTRLELAAWAHRDHGTAGP